MSILDSPLGISLPPVEKGSATHSLGTSSPNEVIFRASVISTLLRDSSYGCANGVNDTGVPHSPWHTFVLLRD